MTRQRLLQVLPLAAIVLLGVELRLLFSQGVIYTDDLFYAHLARLVAEGSSPFAAPALESYAALRIALYGPVAVL